LKARRGTWNHATNGASNARDPPDRDPRMHLQYFIRIPHSLSRWGVSAASQSRHRFSSTPSPSTSVNGKPAQLAQDVDACKQLLRRHQGMHLFQHVRRLVIVGQMDNPWSPRAGATAARTQTGSTRRTRQERTITKPWRYMLKRPTWILHCRQQPTGNSLAPSAARLPIRVGSRPLCHSVTDETCWRPRRRFRQPSCQCGLRH
jgi:hypothetical protein